MQLGRRWVLRPVSSLMAAGLLLAALGLACRDGQDETT